MKRLRLARLAFILSLAVALATPNRSAHALAGVGLDAVRSVMGSMPQSLEELREELKAASESLKKEPDLVDANYRFAILSLNEVRQVKTRDVRSYLARVIVQDPGYKRAWEIWDALVPTQQELKDLRDTLKGRRDTASLYVRSWLALRLGEFGQAARLADLLRASDAAYTARSYWLEAVLAFQQGRDERGSERMNLAIENLDDITAGLMVEDASLIATANELQRYGVYEVEQRGDWLIGFWRRRDTFPLTPANERAGEHQRRIRRARKDYALESNGHGYFTLHERFKDLSPNLDFYSSRNMFDYVEQRPLWLDHRGLVYVRHGKPDGDNRVGSRGRRSETWLYLTYTATPLLFHFVDRLGINEYVLALNLAQATVLSRGEDNPLHVLSNTRNFQELYQRRSNYHRLFQTIANSRSRYELETLLLREAELMSGFLRQVWLYDSSSLLKEVERLPFAAYSASFAANHGLSDLSIYYAIPEKELDWDFDELRFRAEMIIYSRDWMTELGRGEHEFSYQRASDAIVGDDSLIVGAIHIPDLKPGNYRYAFVIREQNSGRQGVSKGQESVDYYSKPWVDLSDLVIAETVETMETKSIFDRHGVRVVPIPTRVIKRASPVKVYFEIYDLATDITGAANYTLDYRLLKIQSERGFFSKLFSFGLNVAGAFFPYYTFLTRAGLFGLEIVTTGPEEGLTKSLETHNTRPADGLTTHVYDLDPTQADKGLYQLYVTVRDQTNGSLDTRSVRLVITD